MNPKECCQNAESHPDSRSHTRQESERLQNAGDKGKPVSWDFVADQMVKSRQYWISTVYPDGRPHVVPVWGIWHENRFHFEGSLQTAWGQNIRQNPNFAVHLPDADKVVIIERTAQIIGDDEIDSTTWDILDSTFQRKYQVDKGLPYIYVRPKRVLAWDSEALTTMTRWVFTR